MGKAMGERTGWEQGLGPRRRAQLRRVTDRPLRVARLSGQQGSKRSSLPSGPLLLGCCVCWEGPRTNAKEPRGRGPGRWGGDSPAALGAWVLGGGGLGACGPPQGPSASKPLAKVASTFLARAFNSLSSAWRTCCYRIII